MNISGIGGSQPPYGLSHGPDPAQDISQLNNDIRELEELMHSEGGVSNNQLQDAYNQAVTDYNKACGDLSFDTPNFPTYATDLGKLCDVLTGLQGELLNRGINTNPPLAPWWR